MYLWPPIETFGHDSDTIDRSIEAEEQKRKEAGKV